jgi:hypothetical protein
MGMSKIKSTKVSFPYDTPDQRFKVWQHTEWIRKYYGVQGIQQGRFWYTKVTYKPGKMIGMWHETYNIYFRDPAHAVHFTLSCL